MGQWDEMAAGTSPRKIGKSIRLAVVDVTREKSGSED